MSLELVEIANTCRLQLEFDAAAHCHGKQTPPAAAATMPPPGNDVDDGGGVDAGVDAQEHELAILRNCDIYAENNHVFFYIQNKLYKFHSHQRLNLSGTQMIVRYSRATKRFYLELPYVAGEVAVAPRTIPVGLQFVLNSSVTSRTYNIKNPTECSFRNCMLEVRKLKRITPICKLQLDDSEELHALTSNYSYGFCSIYSEPLKSDTRSHFHKICKKITSLFFAQSHCNKDTVTRVSEPHRYSPFRRRVEREMHEHKDFNAEQFKLNFIKVQVPDGHPDPAIYKLDFGDIKLATELEQGLHNIIVRQEKKPTVDLRLKQRELDCGLISIMLAICYDVRTTSNDPTCESGWTRSMLSSLLMYFEPTYKEKDTIIIFLRRTLIYPLYRNYTLSTQCVHDLQHVLLSKNGIDWILKQLLLTWQMFEQSEPSRAFLNEYYLEDYIYYLHLRKQEPMRCAQYLAMLGRNIKNSMSDVGLPKLGLNMMALQLELMQDLMNGRRPKVHKPNNNESVVSEDYNIEEEEMSEEGEEEEDEDYEDSNEEDDIEDAEDVYNDEDSFEEEEEDAYDANNEDDNDNHINEDDDELPGLDITGVDNADEEPTTPTQSEQSF